MEPKTTKKPSRKLVVFKRELPFYLMRNSANCNSKVPSANSSVLGGVLCSNRLPNSCQSK